jgi:transketolase
MRERLPRRGERTAGAGSPSPEEWWLGLPGRIVGSVPEPALDLDRAVAATRRLDAMSVNAIRALVMDAVEAAGSGHPGAPMGLAPAALVLWTRHLKHDPSSPDWPDRDRFVLSAGHASMLLYALLHLSGYDLPMEEIRRFRQWGSRTPGHPERGLTPGVETTTGPLGQGLATAVGMAMAEAILAARYNRDDLVVVDHRTWVIASDGDLMEGISHEAASLAGHLRLAKLIVCYDANGISIDGPTSLAFTEDVPARFRAYGWRVESLEDGEDLKAVDAALERCRASDRPSLLVLRTHIASGAPTKQDTAAAHGAPLGAEEVRGAKERMGWPLEPPFFVPEEVRRYLRQVRTRGARARRSWEARFRRYRAAYPEAAAELRDALAGRLPAGWDADLPGFAPTTAPIATRQASARTLEVLARRLPALVGGSADLTESTGTRIDGAPFAPGRAGRFVHFGVREHAMGAALNGMALHGGLIPYGGTFLVFSDYMRPAIRLAALMEAPTIFVFTHDSIGLGEDGPTHQPVEHLASLRAIPGLVVLRPADANETVGAWRLAVGRRQGPTALVLSRQALPVLPGTAGAPVERGAYVLRGPSTPAVCLVATGSEVAIALEAAELLEAEGTSARVVSMPSAELFEAQPSSYRERVLPRTLRTVAIEAASPLGWERYATAVVGLDRFGASAPGSIVMRELGFHAGTVAARARALLAPRA